MTVNECRPGLPPHGGNPAATGRGFPRDTRLRASLVVLILAGLLVTGCEKEHTYSGPPPAALGTTALVSEDYPHLNQLLGGMTGGELFDLLGASLAKLAALQRGDRTDGDDYQALLDLIDGLRGVMCEEQAAFGAEGGGLAMSESSGALVALLESGAGLGDILTQLIAQTGPDVLTSRIYPMLQHLMAADEDLLAGALAGIDLVEPERPYSHDDFQALMDLLHPLLAGEGPYGALHDALGALRDVLTSTQSDLTIGDGRALLELVLDPAGSLRLQGDVLARAAELVLDDERLADDLERLLIAAGDLLASRLEPDGHNAWDGPLSGAKSDALRIAAGLCDLCDPQQLSPAAWRAFIRKARDGLALLEDSGGLAGSLRALAGVDTGSLPQV